MNGLAGVMKARQGNASRTLLARQSMLPAGLIPDHHFRSIPRVKIRRFLVRNGLAAAYEPYRRSVTRQDLSDPTKQKSPHIDGATLSEKNGCT